MKFLLLAFTIAQLSSIPLTAGESKETIVFPAPPKRKEDVPKYIDKMKNEVLPKLREVNSCLASAYLLLAEYRDLKYRTMDAPRSDKPLMLERMRSWETDANLLHNFKYLAGEQDKFMKKLQKMVDEVRNSEGLTPQERIKILDRGVDRITFELGEIVELEEVFINAIDTIAEYLKSLAPRRTPLVKVAASQECKQYNMGAIIAFLYKDGQKSLEAVSLLRTYVLETRVKRHRLVNLMFRAARVDIANQVAQGNVKALDEIRNQIGAIWQMDRLVEKWGRYQRKYFHEFSWTGGLDDIYLQYRRPLRILGAKHSDVSHFLTSANQLSLPEEAKSALTDRLRSAIRVIERNIKRLEGRGWRGQLKRQVDKVESYEGRQEQFGDKCKTFIQAHKKLSPTIQSESDFSIAEKHFASIVELCK